MKNLIVIEGEVVEVESINNYGYTYLECNNGCEYLIFEDRETAGEAVREYYQDMKENDKKEFVCIMGEERLINWACNESDRFGISSFEEFLDRVSEVPEEHLASYDGNEIEVEQMNYNLFNELDYSDKKDCVLYRTN